MSNRGFVIVEPIAGFCWIGCLMGILNYYFIMWLWTKDTYDYAVLVKFGDFNWQDNFIATSYNIWYFLARLNFKITYYSQEIGGHEAFAKNPEAYFHDRNIIYYPQTNLQDSVKTYHKMKEEKNISFIENPNFNLFELIKHKQHRSTLFLLSWDYYILRWEERPRDSWHAGHFVVCSGIRDDKFIIHDPGPDIKMEYLVDKNTLYKAMSYYGDKELYCMMIEYV